MRAERKEDDRAARPSLDLLAPRGRGYAEPTGGWEQNEIHHIRPRAYGGDNDFENLVPLPDEVHHEFNGWWRHYE